MEAIGYWPNSGYSSANVAVGGMEQKEGEKAKKEITGSTP